MINRRDLLRTGAAFAAGAALPMRPGWAHSARSLEFAGPEGLSGTGFDLTIARSPITIDGRKGVATTVNGTVPAPLLRWREGDTLSLRVTNRLEEDTSIHWHGILIPFHMDGVPGVSFPGIKPGETFEYRFPVRQAGTYWYHSHSGLQEQAGHYGPIIIDPADADPVSYDREYVLVLSDWTFMNPHRLFAELKKKSDSLNFQQRTLADFIRDTRDQGLAATIEDRMMWGAMRMSPTDIADVTGATYSYLINGHGPGDNWTALFRPGERVRLRLINAAAMTIFNVRIPGLAMTVVQADGLNVRPLEVDEFQIGVAETYDLIVTPDDHRAFTLMAESIDRSGYARATIAPEAGMAAPIPPLRPRPLLTMKDMGMDHGAMGHGRMGDGMMGQGEMDHGAMGDGRKDDGMMGQGEMDHGAMGDGRKDDGMMGQGEMEHGAMGHGEMDHGAMGHGEMDHGMMGPDNGRRDSTAHDHKAGPGVANLAEQPTYRMDEPGLGLEDAPHRTLTYHALRSLEVNPDPRPTGREIEIHLTSNMERYMWSFDGVKFSEVTEPIRFVYGERLRLTMVNDTMMSHPIHLHGMFFELVNGSDRHRPRKHTVIVKPGEKMSVDITANEPGDWAFHCHLLYHMHAGMMQVVSVLPGHDSHDNHDRHEHGGDGA